VIVTSVRTLPLHEALCRVNKPTERRTTRAFAHHVLQDRLVALLVCRRRQTLPSIEARLLFWQRPHLTCLALHTLRPWNDVGVHAWRRLKHKSTGVVLRSPSMNLVEIPARMMDGEVRHPRSDGRIIGLLPSLVPDRSHVAMTHDGLFDCQQDPHAHVWHCEVGQFRIRTRTQVFT
jgi:hypothetical protein